MVQAFKVIAVFQRKYKILIKSQQFWSSPAKHNPLQDWIQWAWYQYYAEKIPLTSSHYIMRN
jgi:hypothetical protein